MVYDNLDDTVPHLFTDIVAGDADEVENGIHVPGVVHGIFFCQDGHLEHLREKSNRFGLESRTQRKLNGEPACTDDPPSPL